MMRHEYDIVIIFSRKLPISGLNVASPTKNIITIGEKSSISMQKNIKRE